ncbi:MAG: MarR family transcriptional regulator [Pseudomonadales bacterium]|nr:MarR family transcriptional regulator [Pseudomonadales bacterium]
MTQSNTTTSQQNSKAFYCDDRQDLGGDKSIGFLVRVAHSQIIKNIDKELSAYNLTTKQWIPLQIIGLGRADTVAACAKLAGIDGGAMTRMFDRLEKKDLVRRIRREDDRRVVNIALTDKGRELEKFIPDAIFNVLNRQLSGFSKDEFETLKTLLLRLIDNGKSP